MSTSPISSRGSGLRLFDLGALVLAFPIAVGAYERLRGPFDGAPSIDVLWPVLALAVVVWGGSSWLHELYHPGIGRTLTDEMARAFRTVATTAVVLAAIGFVARQTQVPRLLLAAFVVVLSALVFAVRIGRRVAAGAMLRGGAARRYAIVGTGGMAREVVEVIQARPEWGMEFAGFVRVEGTSEGTRGTCLGSLTQLGRILEEEVIDVVVFAVPRERLGDVERAVHICEEQGVEVRISLDILRFGPGRMMVADMDGMAMLAFTRTPVDSIALGLKRTFDIVMSAMVLALLAPVLAGIAIAIKLDSRGPVFFRQRRVGQSGRLFDMMKFRSMHLDAEARLDALRAQNEMTGPVFKMANDPRVTRVGRFLRRTSLDEFPQFWNVLRGEMSIVGPRPPIPAEVRQYKRWQRRRLSMKPGITCIWQISGRNNIDFERWMELDLQYIDEWSLWGDIEICFRTIPAVLSARGAR